MATQDTIPTVGQNTVDINSALAGGDLTGSTPNSQTTDATDGYLAPGQYTNSAPLQTPVTTPVVSGSNAQSEAQKAQDLITYNGNTKAQADALDASALPTDKFLKGSGKPNPNYQAPVVTPPTPVVKSPEQTIADEGKTQYWSKDTGQPEMIPTPTDGTVPTGYTTTDPINGMAQDTVSSADGFQYKELADGTYVAYNPTTNTFKQINQGTFDAQKQISKVTSDLTNLQNNGILSQTQQSQIDAITSQYQNLINQQTVANNNETGTTTMAENLYGMGNTLPGQGQITKVVNDGIAKITDLTNKMTAAIAQMKQGFLQDDQNAVKDAWDTYQTSQTETQTALNLIQSSLVSEQKTAQTKLDASGYAFKQQYPDMVWHAGMTQDEIDNALQNSKAYFTDMSKKGAAQISGITGLNGDQLDSLNTIPGMNVISAQNVAGIISGKLPPLIGFGANSKEGIAIKAGLNALGFDLSKATLDWNATNKFINSTNSSQQVRMKQAENSVEQALPSLKYLSDDYTRSGFKFVNKADLVAATNGAFGEEAASKAQAILGQISLITDELGQTFMGGNSPTDQAFKLAASVLQGNFTKDVMDSQIKLIEQNLQYRKASWNNVTAQTTNGGNFYTSPTTTSTNNNTSGKVQTNSDGTLQAVDF